MSHSINRVVLLCGLFALTAVVGGCQRGSTLNLIPVEGAITKDGRPLPDIEVIFFPDLDAGVQGPPRSVAVTDESGRYRLRTHNGEEGAVVGKHRVVIHDLEALMEGRGGRNARGPQTKEAAPLPPEDAKRLEEQWKMAAKPSRVPRHYEHFDETPLRAEVGPIPLIFDIVIP